MVAKGFVLYNITINKICPNDIFKIIFDNEKNFFKIALVSFYKKENSNTSTYSIFTSLWDVDRSFPIGGM